MEQLSILGHGRPNFMKLYEVMRAAAIKPRLRTGIMLQAGLPGGENNVVIFCWLLDQGFVELVPYDKLDRTLGQHSKVIRHNKGFYTISAKGREAIRLYDQVLKHMGLDNTLDRRKQNGK